MSKNTKVPLETAAKRAGLNILTGENWFMDSVGACRHSIHECHGEIDAVFVSGRTYLPLSPADEIRHCDACCGIGAWKDPGAERDALAAVLQEMLDVTTATDAAIIQDRAIKLLASIRK